MAFLRFFELLDFDRQGEVCETAVCDKQTAQANFLYLISKYNQNFLKEQSMPVPEFFKNQLSEVMQAVKEGGDFVSAEKLVLSNCLPAVQRMASASKTDREFVEQLNSKVNVGTDRFAKLQSGNINSKLLTYVLTKTAGDLEMSIERNKNSDEGKSKSFKNMISYNALIGTAERLESRELSVEDFVRQVS